MKRNIFYIALITIIFLLNKSNIQAKTYCTSEDFKRIKAIANEVNINYEILRDDQERLYYKIIVEGLTDELYIKETLNDVIIYNDDPYANITEGGNLTFKIYYEYCDESVIRTINYKLPRYNKYAYREECDGVDRQELKVCNETYQAILTEEEFKKQLEEYKNKQEEQIKIEKKQNKIINLLKEYYIYIIIVIVIIITITIFTIIRKNKYKLD